MGERAGWPGCPRSLSSALRPAALRRRSGGLGQRTPHTPTADFITGGPIPAAGRSLRLCTGSGGRVTFLRPDTVGVIICVMRPRPFQVVVANPGVVLPGG